MSDEYCIRKSGLKTLATVFFSKNLQLIISLFGITFILGQLLNRSPCLMKTYT